jgi:NADP-dependent 3-hydroxy acid dehydrogenase YdfG
METLLNKIVLVVGGTGGIGAETCKLLHQSGAKVYVTGRNAETLNTICNAIGIPVKNRFVVDLKDTDSIHPMVEEIQSMTGAPIDILINAAGIGIIKSFESLSIQDFKDSLDVNLVGAFSLIQAVLPKMKEQKKGLIINIPGVLGKTPMAGAAAYAASKYGLNGMLKSLREELKRTEIRITNIYMGGVDSSFWDNIDLKVQRDKMIAVKEAAKSIWFLCQQPSSAVVSEMVIQPFNHQAI